ncbi:MAG: helix-turn-helix transcriptional regulator [Bacteroidota bacterium]|jgi:transcriptional regulator with XRE-family HTH domain
MSIKHEIGQRLREFGERRSGSMAAFARELGIRPQNLNAYLSGKRIPGNKLEEKLRGMKCDMIWLQYGKSRELINHQFNVALGTIVNAQGDKVVSKEDFEFLREVKLRGIDSIEKLDSILRPITMVAETIAKYNITKKRRK